MTNRIIGTSGDDTLVGAEGVTLIRGKAGNDEIFGANGQGKVTLSGGSGDDLIQGGDGIDIIIGGQGNDTLFGAAGDDKFYFNAIDTDNDQAIGGDGNDKFIIKSGDSGNITLLGAEGRDTFVVYMDDVEAGNVGFAIADFSSEDAVKIRATSQDASDLDVLMSPSGSTVHISNTVDGDHLDLITADLGVHRFTVQNMADQEASLVVFNNNFSDVKLTGGKGNDQLISGGGNDTIIGGAGADKITVQAGDADVIQLAAGDSALISLGAAPSADSVDSIEGWSDTFTTLQFDFDSANEVNFEGSTTVDFGSASDLSAISDHSLFSAVNQDGDVAVFEGDGVRAIENSLDDNSYVVYQIGSDRYVVEIVGENINDSNTWTAADFGAY